MRVFDGILGWSNKRAGVEFYHSWEDGRWGRRQGHYAEGEPERGGWGRLLADEIERETHGRVEGSDILVVVGTKEEIAAARDALASQPVPAPEASAPEGWDSNRDFRSVLAYPEASAPREALDVERLARALRASDGDYFRLTAEALQRAMTDDSGLDWGAWAKAVARKYALAAAPQDPATPEDEA